MKIRSILIYALVLLAACTDKPHDVVKVDKFPSIYPDYVGVTIPQGIAPLNFALFNDDCNCVVVDVKGSKGGTLSTSGRYADFDIDEWHKLTAANIGGTLTFSVCAKIAGKWLQYADFDISVSTNPLPEWGLTYRRIAPGYGQYGLMGIYQRSLSTFDEYPIVVNTQSKGMCVNCHTSNRGNAEQTIFHARGAHGATVITRNGTIDVLEAKNSVVGGSLVYPDWHTSGRMCAFSSNNTAQMFHTHDTNRIEVYDEVSDIYIYDVENQSIIANEAFARADVAENCPTFSACGDSLYFTSCQVRQYPQAVRQQQYSLCRVAIDTISGKLYGQVDTLINASVVDKSVCWPRPSPDGNYVAYALADYGYFSVWHQESDIWLLDLKSGKQYKLNELNSNRAESFPKWSSNSKWLMFVSRRDDGLYSRIYFSMIDNNGHATKPFMLPQRNPKEFYQLLYDSYNTPDFIAEQVQASSKSIVRKLESSERQTVMGE